MDAILDKVDSVMDPVKKVTLISRCKYFIIIIFLIEAATLVNIEPELIQPVLADPTVFFFYYMCWYIIFYQYVYGLRIYLLEVILNLIELIYIRMTLRMIVLLQMVIVIIIPYNNILIVRVKNFVI